MGGGRERVKGRMREEWELRGGDLSKPAPLVYTRTHPNLALPLTHPYSAYSVTNSAHHVTDYLQRLI